MLLLQVCLLRQVHRTPARTQTLAQTWVMVKKTMAMTLWLLECMHVCMECMFLTTVLPSVWRLNQGQACLGSLVEA